MVKSGVRQGDALSCIIFILVMEPLALAFQRSVLLRGIELSNGRKIKCCMYADDTATFPRNLPELIEIGRILELFEKASGQRVNWVKTFLMLLGGQESLTIEMLPDRLRAMKLLRSGDSYKHLGIPVGHKIGPALGHFWDEMIGGMEDRIRSWLRLRLS